MANLSSKWLTSLALLALCGCNSGTLEGVHGGTLTGDSSPNFEAIFLEDGNVWVITGQDLGSSFQVNDLWMGTGTSTEGTNPLFNSSKYASTDIRDFGTTGAPAGSLHVAYSGASSERRISGTARFPDAGAIELAGNTLAGSSYSYDDPAALTDVAGIWTFAGGPTVTLSISPTGTVSWNENSVVGCGGNGTMTPRPSGKNILDVSITFGQQACQFQNQTVTGIALSYPITATGQRELIVALVNVGRTGGMVKAGIR